LLNFRHLLEQHQIGAAPFAKVGELLLANGMKLSGGTIVDATLIAAPPSTKNAAGERDPEMHQSKKGNQWYFGMKLHIGADSQSGLIHSASVTAGNVHDSQELPNLLHGGETRLYGDSAYRGDKQRKRLKDIAPRAKDFTNKRAYRNRPLTEADKDTNRHQPAQFKRALQGRTSVPDAQTHLGLCQGALSWPGQECQSRVCHARDAQSQQMGKAAHRTGASSVTEMQCNIPISLSKSPSG